MAKRTPPINYDFGKNWDTIIIPLLKRDDVKMSIEKCIRLYDKNFDLPKREKKPRYLSYVGRRDAIDVIEEKMKEKGIRQKKYDLKNYVLEGGCHWINPTFGLTLARLVEPGENWIIKRSNIHTSIFNKNYSKCFDILAWAFSEDERLERYTLKEEVDGKDPTMGGFCAYSRACHEIEINEINPDLVKRIYERVRANR